MVLLKKNKKNWQHSIRGTNMVAIEKKKNPNVSKDGLLADLVACEVMPTTWVHTD